MLRWIEYLTARFGQDITVILHGVSMGAATVLQLAGSRCPDCVKLIISDCAIPVPRTSFPMWLGMPGCATPSRCCAVK